MFIKTPCEPSSLKFPKHGPIPVKLFLSGIEEHRPADLFIGKHCGTGFSYSRACGEFEIYTGSPDTGKPVLQDAGLRFRLTLGV